MQDGELIVATVKEVLEVANRPKSSKRSARPNPKSSVARPLKVKKRAGSAQPPQPRRRWRREETGCREEMIQYAVGRWQPVCSRQMAVGQN
jgi:hypothetical protein